MAVAAMMSPTGFRILFWSLLANDLPVIADFTFQNQRLHSTFILFIISHACLIMFSFGFRKSETLTHKTKVQVGDPTVATPIYIFLRMHVLVTQSELDCNGA